MHLHVIKAILNRNFISYFSNPTGYVFIVVFVFLSSLAAFWPNEFFNANLCNLNQLNKWLPYIMLVFIPAISMSVWAEERKQGTDELLLTIPAGDFDVVIGKYLASVAIYTVALLFSFVCNLTVLLFLGSPDLGLAAANYLGYWIVGATMLSVGMVASFLTSNVTIAFILGVILNAPLALAGLADAVPFLPDVTRSIKKIGVAEQFMDFSRGVISGSSLGYFVGITAAMLYACMVLIGRRHWRGGKDVSPMAWHYSIRFLALLVAVGGIVGFLTKHDRLRADITAERLSSLTPKTRELIAKLDPAKPVEVYAYVSEVVPELYSSQRLNFLSTLDELAAMNSQALKVYVSRNVEPFSDEAAVAEQSWGIKPERVPDRSRGTRSDESIIMGFACRSGLDKVVVPFVNRGLPVEYELVRSILTVSQPERKRLGIVSTDAKLFSSFNMQTMSSSQDQPIVQELKKQYEVVQVDPAKPITDKFAVLLAVQPSSLSHEQMENFAAAVKSGQPTAIFEDPAPVYSGDVAGTAQPKRPPGGMFGGAPPQPKGDIQRSLFKAMGVRLLADSVVFQLYTPFRKFADVLPHEFVTIDKGCATPRPVNEDHEASAGLQRLIFPFPGAVINDDSPYSFTELVMTGQDSGQVRYADVFEPSMFGETRLNPRLPLLEGRSKNKSYCLAAHIKGKPKKSSGPQDEGASTASGDADNQLKKVLGDAADGGQGGDKKPANEEYNVIVVSDIDCLAGWLFDNRSQGADPDQELDLDFDNVTFVLNCLDVLAGDDRFVVIRRHRPKHRVLESIGDAQRREAEELQKARDNANTKELEQVADLEKRLDDKVKSLNDDKKLNIEEKRQKLALYQENERRRITAWKEQAQREREAELKKIKQDLARNMRHVQDSYKFASVILPPIPPLLLGLYVYFNKRAREREGVAKSRLL